MAENGSSLTGFGTEQNTPKIYLGNESKMRDIYKRAVALTKDKVNWCSEEHFLEAMSQPKWRKKVYDTLEGLGALGAGWTEDKWHKALGFDPEHVSLTPDSQTGGAPIMPEDYDPQNPDGRAQGSQWESRRAVPASGYDPHNAVPKSKPESTNPYKAAAPLAPNGIGYQSMPHENTEKSDSSQLADEAAQLRKSAAALRGTDVQEMTDEETASMQEQSRSVRMPNSEKVTADGAGWTFGDEEELEALEKAYKEAQAVPKNAVTTKGYRTTSYGAHEPVTEYDHSPEQKAAIDKARKAYEDKMRLMTGEADPEKAHAIIGQLNSDNAVDMIIPEVSRQMEAVKPIVEKASAAFGDWRKQHPQKQPGFGGVDPQAAFWQYEQEARSTKEGRDAAAARAAHNMLVRTMRHLDNYNTERSQRGESGWTTVANFGKNAAKGFVQKVSDISTWDFGISDMDERRALMDAIEKKEDGKPLSDAENALLNAAATDMYVRAVAETGLGFQAGEVTAESLPFMLDMMTNPVAKSGNSIAARILRVFTKDIGRGGLRHATRRFGGRLAADLGKQELSNLGRGAAMAIDPVQVNRTADAVLRERIGSVIGEFDENGHFNYEGREGARGWMESALRGFSKQTVENATEFEGDTWLGGMGDLFGAVSKREFSKLAQSRPAQMMVSAFEDADVVRHVQKGFRDLSRHLETLNKKDFLRVTKQLRKQAHISGVIGETNEEILGGLYNSLPFIGDEHPFTYTDEDGVEHQGVLSWRNYIETMVTMLPQQVAMGALGGFSYGAQKANALNRTRLSLDALRNLPAFQGQTEEYVRAQFDALDADNYGRELVNLALQHDDPMTREAIMRYGIDLQYYRGLDEAERQDLLHGMEVSSQGMHYGETRDGQRVIVRGDGDMVSVTYPDGTTRLESAKNITMGEEIHIGESLAHLHYGQTEGQKPTEEGQQQQQQVAEAAAAPTEPGRSNAAAVADGGQEEAEPEQENGAETAENRVADDLTGRRVRIFDAVDGTEADGEVLGLGNRVGTQRVRLADGRTLDVPMEDITPLADGRDTVHNAVAELGLDESLFTVVTDASELPADQTEAAEAIRRGEAVEGWFDPNTGKTFLYAPNLTDMARAKQVIFHELVAHEGLRRLAGEEKFGQLCDSVWSAMSDADRRERMEYIERRALTDEEFAALANNPAKLRAAADEYMAKIAEGNIEDIEPSVLRTIIDTVRQWLRGLQGLEAVEMSDDFIIGLLRESYRNLREGKENEGKGKKFTQEEASDFIAQMEQHAEIAPELELTPENWAAQFGERGEVETPIGTAKMGDNQYLKLAQQGRNGKLGMVKPTLENPDVIIEDKRPAKDGSEERSSAYVFVKTFLKPDGSRYYHFTSVTVSRDGMEIIISNQERSANRISKLLQQGKVTWINEAFSLHPTTQIDGSVRLNDSNSPTSTDNQGALLGFHSSELRGKGTQESGTEQENAREIAPMPMFADRNGRQHPDFAHATAEQSHRYIYEESGLTRAEADAFVAANQKAATDGVKQLQGQAPKMRLDIEAYKDAKAAWQQRMEAAQRTLDQWNAVSAIEQSRRLDERRRAEEELAARHDEALAQARAEYEARKQAEAERKAVGHGNPMPAITEKWQNAAKVEGARDEMVLSDGTRLKGRYVLHESGASSPSHNPATWEKTDGFPTDENGNSVNDRDYERDRDAQQHTENIARQYDQRALQSVPVVSRDGVVLSGNGRTMAGQLAARDNTDGAYIGYLKEYAEKFGFTPEQVESMQHPRVSFVPDEAMPYTAETFAKFNQQEMKSQNKTEQAVKLGKTVSDADFKSIVRTINGYDTLADFYADPEASLGAVYDLHKAGVISDAQLAEMVDGARGSERLSTIGREFLENILIGKAFAKNPDVVRMLTAEPSMRQTVITGLGEIADNLALGEGWSLQDELADAVKLCFDARQDGVKYGDNVSSHARQGVLFADPDQLQTVADFHNATMLMLADVLNDRRVSLLKTTLALYNDNARLSASGQLDMFSDGILSQEEILRNVIKYINNNYGNRKEIESARAEAVERRKASGVQQDGTAPAVDSGGEGAGRGERAEKNVSSGLKDPRSMSPEDRQERGEKLRGTTPIEVASKQIVATENKTARQAAEEWWDKNVGEPQRYETEAGNVEINRNTVESSLAHRYGQMKLDAITSLVDGFENAVYLGMMPDGTRQEGVLNHYFAYPISYDGKLCYVFCRALQDNNTNRLYVHEVFVAENIKKGNTLQTAASQPHGGIALYRDILANVLERPLLWERGAQAAPGDVATPTITTIGSQQGDETASRTKGQGNVSFGKVGENSENRQKIGEKTDNQTLARRENAGEVTKRPLLDVPVDAAQWMREHRGQMPTTADLFPTGETERALGRLVDRRTQEFDNGVQLELETYEGGHKKIMRYGSDYIEQAYYHDGQPMSIARFQLDTNAAQMRRFIKADANGRMFYDERNADALFGQLLENAENGTRFSFAERLARAKEETEKEPSEAQKKAGNYKKGHIDFGGYQYVIENPAGTKRRGKDADGHAWEVTMHNTYGYILGKYGTDGDHLDMFLNDEADLDQWAGTVYVVDQVDPKTGEFDEHKVMYGFDDELEARAAYLANYSEGWQGLGAISGVRKELFDKWLASSEHKRKPFADHAIVKDEILPHPVMSPKTATIDDAIKFSIRVNHNSPYLLKKADGSFVDPETGERLGFDHRFMGSGEGAQAHGWGSYFSVNDVREYAGPDVTATRRNQTDAEWFARDFFKDADGDKKLAREAFEKVKNTALRNGRNELGGIPISEIETAFAFMEQSSRNHYDVEIPDNDGTNYIEENGWASQVQYDRIIDQAKKEGLSDWYVKRMSAGKSVADEAGNNQIYEYTKQEFDYDDKAASEFLNRAGFVGIHYDGRQDGECYVIFDEKDAKIVDHVRFSRKATKEASMIEPDEEHKTEIQAIEKRRSEWLTPDNLNWAKGKKREEIIERFGNEPLPVAYIPTQFLKYVDAELTDNRVYSGMGYFIDHAANHHASISPEKYRNIQKVLDAPDEVKAITDNGNHSIAFIKRIDRFNAVVIEVEKTDDGRIVWHKSFYDQKKKPYANKGTQLYDASSGGGVSPIIQAENSTHDGSLSVLDDGAKIAENSHDSNLSGEKVLTRKGDEAPQASTTYEEGLANARRLGYSKRQYDAMLERQERNARISIANAISKLGLTDNVEVMDSADGLTGRKQTAKGWYDTETGKITIVLDNHHSLNDVMKTILHEGVAHYGLRDLFGAEFDEFLDKVYQFADEEVRSKIDESARQDKMEVREATEEYLARLAEETDFENPASQEWWGKVKSWFVAMVRKFMSIYGDISDNELKYLLYRSYRRLENQAKLDQQAKAEKDLQLQKKLKVGQYAEDVATGGNWFDNNNAVADEIGILFSRRPFAERQREAVERKGIVAPNLASKSVEVVEADAKHGFRNFDAARQWAKENVVRTYSDEETGGKGEISIGVNAVKKFLSQAAIEKSESKDVHMAVLKVLPEVLRTSIDAEQHPNYSKIAGERSADNEISPKEIIHRFYGAVLVGDEMHRVKTTIKEIQDGIGHAYSYEATKIELLISGSTASDALSNSDLEPRGGLMKPSARNRNISAAKLLQGVEKSYDKGKKLLDESENLPENVQNGIENVQNVDENVRFSRVTDKQKLDELNKGKTVKVYRAMQLRDGKLYPPMAGMVDGKWQNAQEVGEWYQSDERPDLLDKNGKFVLKKNPGDGGMPVAYNPYWHTSRFPLNDQFASAWNRPELVTVEVEIPESELTSGYKAEGAKNAVGETAWKAGPVADKLYGTEDERKVILSRYNRLVRIVPDSEVAASAANILKKHGLDVPFNVVTPSLRDELVKQGVTISEPTRHGSGVKSLPAYEEWMGGARFSRIKPVNDKFNADLDKLTEDNADSVILSLGEPSAILRAGGVANLPMRLYGSKVIKKMKKHGFSLTALRDLPLAVADPIAVFNNYGKVGNRSILTELKTEQGNVLVSLEVGKGMDIDFNIITSAFGKSDNKIVNWLNKGYATYIDKRKALDYLHLAAPIAAASNNQELYSAANVVRDFQNPKLSDEKVEDRTLFSRQPRSVDDEIRFSRPPFAPLSDEELAERERQRRDYTARMNRMHSFREMKDIVTDIDYDRNLSLDKRAELIAEVQQRWRDMSRGDTAADPKAEAERLERAKKQQQSDELEREAADLVRSIGFVQDGGTPAGLISRVREFINNRLSKEAGRGLTAQGIKSLLRQLDEARMADDVEQLLQQIRYTLNSAELKSVVEELEKALKARVEGATKQGLRTGLMVDAMTQQVMDDINGTFKQLAVSSVDEQIGALNRERLALAKKYGYRTAEDARKAKDADFLAEYSRLTDELNSKKQERSRVLEQKTVESYDALAARFGTILEEMNDYRDRGEEIPETLVQERIALPIRQRLAELQALMQEMDKAEADRAEIEKQMTGTRGDERRRLTEEIRTTFDQIVQMQRRAVLMARDLDAEVRDLLMEGGARRAEQMRKQIEDENRLVNAAIRAVRKNPVEQRNQPAGTIKHADGHAWTTAEKVQAALADTMKGWGAWWQKFMHAWNAPIWSFNYILKYIDQNHHQGDGLLYRMLMKDSDGALAANDAFAEGLTEFGRTVDDKVRAMFGKDMAALMDESHRRLYHTPILLTKHDRVTGRTWTEPVELTRGQALYIWLASRQSAGHDKLQEDGWDKAAVAEVERLLGAKWLEFGRWITDDYLPTLRATKYNETYRHLFGTSMHLTQHYFPLKIWQVNVHEKGEIGESADMDVLPSSATGSLIMRQKNTLPLDTDVDALDVLLDYGRKMERWNAMAQLTRKLNVLFHSNAFRNLMDANHGDGFFHNYWKPACDVVTNNYDSKEPSAIGRMMGKLQNSFLRGAIGYRWYTAAKQMLSYPLFAAYSADLRFQTELLGNVFRGVGGSKWVQGNWQWAMAHLPAFRERVAKGDMGIEGLNDEGLLGKFEQKVGEWGMAANKLVDALTVAAGARAVYNLEYRKAMQRGLDKAEADRCATACAEICFNESQQSSRAEFSSAMQKNRDLLSRSVTAFQNSNISYRRMLLEGVHDVTRADRIYKIQLADIARGRVEEGAPSSVAEAKAQRDAAYARGVRKILASVLFGAGLWYLGGVPGQVVQLLTGDDDDDEERAQYSRSFVVNLVANCVMGALTNGSSAGTLVQSIWNTLGNNLLSDEKRQQQFEVNPLQSYELLNEILDDAMKVFGKGAKEGNDASVEMLLSHSTQWAAKSVGINPETWTNFTLGVADAIRRGKLELQDALFVLNVPGSQRKIIVERMARKADAAGYMRQVEEASRLYEPGDWRASEWLAGTREITDKKRKELLDAYIEARNPQWARTSAVLEEIRKAVGERQKELEQWLVDNGRTEKSAVIRAKAIADVLEGKDWGIAPNAYRRLMNSPVGTVPKTSTTGGKKEVKETLMQRHDRLRKACDEAARNIGQDPEALNRAVDALLECERAMVEILTPKR
ncbi:MAG: hypothetical protein K6E73_10660 [Bacteroidales bacterium]|nr:hypothetical protein [Bacteroidales bacterium]